MSTSRKMWAPTSWGAGDEGVMMIPGTKSVAWATNPVLVTSLEGAPDFAPGHRVRHEVGAEGEVVGPPFVHAKTEQWVVPVVCECSTECWNADALTKLPREKTVTLRVTGPEGDVERVANGGPWPATFSGWRVERLEDKS